MNEFLDEEADTWECSLCDGDFDCGVSGWLGNYHPLCLVCADAVYSDPNSRHHHRLTYHYKAGDIERTSAPRTFKEPSVEPNKAFKDAVLSSVDFDNTWVKVRRCDGEDEKFV